MEKVARLHRKIAPEFTSLIEERYDILRHIQFAQPVGRRALAAMLEAGERTVRSQVDFLKSAGLVEFSPLGMTITQEGQDVIADLAEYVHALRGLSDLGEELARRLGLQQVVIIPGDCDVDSAARRELGRAGAGVLARRLGNNMTVAVSGGSTMAAVAESMNITAPATLIVPARGGLGEKVEYQANTIAAVMAARLGGRYRLMHIPDGVGEDALEAILANDAGMRTVTDAIKRADILIHGIGQAGTMAARRGFAQSFINELLERGAVGEALGYYCTLKGKIVHITGRVGLRLDNLAEIDTVIAVAGGRKKAEAIVAVACAGGQDILVTDEAAARAIQIILNEFSIN